MHQSSVFGNAELEQLASAAAARCREEVFTQRLPFGPMTAAQAYRVEMMQRLVIDDARWAMREQHAWDIRESIYAVFDACNVTSARGARARAAAAEKGLLSTDLRSWVRVLRELEELEGLKAGSPKVFARGAR